MADLWYLDVLAGAVEQKQMKGSRLQLGQAGAECCRKGFQGTSDSPGAPGSAVAPSASHRNDGLLLWLQGDEFGLLTLLPPQDGFPEPLLGLNQVLYLPCSGFGAQRGLYALFS